MSLTSWLPGGLASSAESNDTLNMSDTDRNNSDSTATAGTSSAAPVSKLDDVVNSTAHHELVKAAISAAAETRDEVSYLQHFRSGLKVANIRALAGAVFQLQRKLVAADKTNKTLEASIAKGKVNNVDNTFREVKHRSVGKKSVQAKPSPVVTKNPFQALVEREGDDVNNAVMNNVDTAAPAPPAVCPSVKEMNGSLCNDKSKCNMAHPDQCKDYDSCWPNRRPDCNRWHLAVPLSVHYRQIKERRRLERERSSRKCRQLYAKPTRKQRETPAPGATQGPGFVVNLPSPTNIDTSSRANMPGSSSSGGSRTGALVLVLPPLIPPAPFWQQQQQRRRHQQQGQWQHPGRSNYDTEFPPLNNADVNKTVAELLRALNINNIDSRRITEPENSLW